MIKDLCKFWACHVFSPKTLVKEKYEAFKTLLAEDFCAHQTMAELEKIFYTSPQIDLQAVIQRYNQLDTCVSSMVEALLKMHPTRHADLDTYYKKFNAYVRFMLEPAPPGTRPPFTLKIDDIPPDNPTLTGTKAFNLARINRELGIPVPRGFVVTVNAFNLFMEQNRLTPAINRILSKLDIHCPRCLADSANEINRRVMAARLPQEILSAITGQITSLERSLPPPLTLAVRSSAVGEDTLTSFAGQYLTLLAVDPKEVCHAYKRVIAGKYSAKALFYRISQGLFDHETPMAVLVLGMINALASGIVYTRSIDAPHGDNLVIHSVNGLGAPLVEGKATHHTCILSKRNAPSTIPPLHADKTPPLPGPIGVATLARWGQTIEDFFSSPQDIEWTMDMDHNLFILQSRPLNLHPNPPKTPTPFLSRPISNPVLVQGGETAAPGTATGTVFIVTQPSDLLNLPPEAIVVSRNAGPGLVMALDRARAVVTDLGSCASHLATVAREFNTPTLVNTKNATSSLVHGQRVTVDADHQTVYQGKVTPLLSCSKVAGDTTRETPFIKAMAFIMEFISPLGLVDPTASAFIPQGCRSIHDIIRFAHEAAIQEMFCLGRRRGGRKKGAKKLVADLPMLFYLLDVGGGLSEPPAHPGEVKIDEITSIPLGALLNGLNHPDISWSSILHFDWESHDRITLAGGIISPQAVQFGSYAIFSRDYLNVNLRFGYHFVIIDALCTPRETCNHILFRFSGGGADTNARVVRAGFISGVLKNIGFEVTVCEDLVDARFHMGNVCELTRVLDLIGRLLGATRLMDLYIMGSLQTEDRAQNPAQNMPEESPDPRVENLSCTPVKGLVDRLVDDFMNGRYDFSATPGCAITRNEQ